MLITVSLLQVLLALLRVYCASDEKSLLIPSSYNKFRTPNEEDGKTTYVYIKLDILDIDEIIEAKMEYSMQLYFNQYWRDERLNLSFFEKYTNYRIPLEWTKDLWVPDTIFENSKEGWLYDLSVPNIVMKIIPFRYIQHYARYAVKVSCSMELQNYPMDTQHCMFITSSLAYNDTTMLLRWIHEREVESGVIEDVFMADIKPLKYYVSNVTPGKRSFQWSSGNFTSLYANFTFVRYISSHIMNVYVPSSLIVILSFMTFWLDVRSVPARVALGLTSLLTLSTQASQARNDLPPINYLTALDVWLFSCMILVFLSLLEYAIVYSIHTSKVRKSKLIAISQKDSWAKPSRRIVVSGSFPPETANVRGDEKKKTPEPPKNFAPLAEFEDDSQFLDKICRILFPTSFVIFLLIYWIVYSR